MFSARLLLTGLLSFATVTCCDAQDNIKYFQSNSAVQYGYALKVQAEIGSNKNWLKFRVGVSAGAGAFMGKNWCYPSLHTDLMFYGGGIGSKRPGVKKPAIDAEATISYTLTTGIQNRMKMNHWLRPGIRNYPLYYFNTFTAQPLQNPYNWSLSIGGNLIFFLSRKTDRFQQVGFLNGHFDRFQVNYINDGPPFFPPFGDRFDRLHTGGGYITFHGDDAWAINLVELGFNKFTGYSRNAYELSNRIGAGYIYYKDTSQQYYNKSRIYLNVANTSKKIGMSVNFYNYSRLDVQHKIHLSSFYPLHVVPYKGHTGIGGVYYYNQGKIGLQ